VIGRNISLFFMEKLVLQTGKILRSVASRRKSKKPPGKRWFFTKGKEEG
jgi:hypothetical protein